MRGSVPALLTALSVPLALAGPAAAQGLDPYAPPPPVMDPQTGQLAQPYPGSYGAPVAPGYGDGDEDDIQPDPYAPAAPAEPGDGGYTDPGYDSYGDPSYDGQPYDDGDDSYDSDDGDAYAMGAVTLAGFQAALSPYGSWIDYGGYGEVWVPSAGVVGASFQPYTCGSWALTRYGWTWDSCYDWGWAPFHYGRWIVAAGYGWAWVPGTVWAPSWVDWRVGGGYIGWCAMGPEGYEYPGSYTGWNFVDERNYYNGGVGVLPPAKVGALWGKTVPIYHAVGTGRLAYNAGPRPEYIAYVTGRPVHETALAGLPRVSPPRSLVARGAVTPLPPHAWSRSIGAPALTAPGRSPRGGAPFARTTPWTIGSVASRGSAGGSYGGPRGGSYGGRPAQSFGYAPATPYGGYRPAAPYAGYAPAAPYGGYRPAAPSTRYRPAFGGGGYRPAMPPGASPYRPAPSSVAPAQPTVPTYGFGGGPVYRAPSYSRPSFGGAPAYRPAPAPAPSYRPAPAPSFHSAPAPSFGGGGGWGGGARVGGGGFGGRRR